MDTLNLHEEDPSVFDNFIHRNTRTEISNFEGSFRPCLFSRIESSSSFESSFENSGDNFSEIIKEERPLSKSYKPDSVLKTSFLTERPNSPSFKEFDARNTEKDFLGTFKEILPKFEGNLDKSDAKPKEKSESFEKVVKHDDFSKDVVKIDGHHFMFKKGNNEIEKEAQDDKFLTLIDIISQKDDEIKDLRTQVIEKEKEISENSLKMRAMQGKILKLSEENNTLLQNLEISNEKLCRSENNSQKLQSHLNELQKELQRLEKGKKEDRIRKITEDQPRPEKLEAKIKDLLSETDFLKQELQKRPTVAQYQSSISRIEELEGMLSNRKKPLKSERPERSDSLIPSLLEVLKINNPSEIIPSVKSLKSPNANSKLFCRISSLITDCVPPGTFKDGPKHRDVWKFIRNVMESYIQLKKNDDHLVIAKIQGCLGIGENSNVYQEVLKIYNSLHFMELVFDKLKSKLGLSPHVTTEEVEKAVDDL